MSRNNGITEHHNVSPFLLAGGNLCVGWGKGNGHVREGVRPSPKAQNASHGLLLLSSPPHARQKGGVGKSENPSPPSGSSGEGWAG